MKFKNILLLIIMLSTFMDLVSSVDNNRVKLNDIEIIISDSTLSKNDAIEQLRELYNDSAVADNAERKAAISYELGKLYFSEANYVEALKFCQKAYLFYDKNNKLNQKANVSNLLGNIHYHIADDKCLDFWIEAKEIYKKLGKMDGFVGQSNNIASYYLNKQKYQKAVEYLKLSEEYLEDTESYRIKVAFLNNYGLVYKKLGNYDKAIEYYQKSVSLKKNVNDRKGLGITYLNLANLFYRIREYSKSKKFYELAKIIADEITEKEILYRSYYGLYLIADQKEEYEEALKNYVEADKIKSEIQGLELQKKTKELQEKFELYLSKKEISNLKKENAAKENQINKTRLIAVLSIFLVVFLIKILVNEVKKNRLKLKFNNLLQKKNIQLNKYNKELKESESKLKEAIDLKNKIITIIGHDIKNSLNTIISPLALLQLESKKAKVPKIQRFSNIVYESALNLNSILNNLISWAKLNNKDFSNKFEIFDVKEEILSVANQMKVNSANKSIKLTTDLVSLKVKSDKNICKTVTRNLLSNAVKFTHKGGRVRVISKKEKDLIIIRVIDNGIGIDKDKIDKVFDFNKSFSKGTEQENGSGLGLNICKEFAKIIGGDLKVKSEKGKGSTFTFLFPEGINN